MDPPVGLGHIRGEQREIERRLRPLRDAHGVIYQPLELSDKRPLRLLQGYLFKLPACLFELLVGGLSVDRAALPEEFIDPVTYSEGRVRQIQVNQIERDSKARAACIRHYGAHCAICGFDFEEVYGELGRGFIHVHHVIPAAVRSAVAQGESYEVDPVRDLLPVCPNCHAMIHVGGGCRDIEEIRRLVE